MYSYRIIFRADLPCSVLNARIPEGLCVLRPIVGRQLMHEALGTTRKRGKLLGSQPKG